MSHSHASSFDATCQEKRREAPGGCVVKAGAAVLTPGRRSSQVWPVGPGLLNRTRASRRPAPEGLQKIARGERSEPRDRCKTKDARPGRGGRVSGGRAAWRGLCRADRTPAPLRGASDTSVS